MTDTYNLDPIDGSNDERTGDENAAPDGDDRSADNPLGVPIPDEHVGAFVAEVFEDAERGTTWESVVSAMVASEARDAWESLSPREQAVEVLEMAEKYDRRAVKQLQEIPLDESADVIDEITEAKRLRRNADMFRDGVSSAYESGHLDDDDLVAAVEAVDFDTEIIARREELLEQAAKVHDFDFRPYGGTLLQESDRETADPTGSETW